MCANEDIEKLSSIKIEWCICCGYVYSWFILSLSLPHFMAHILVVYNFQRNICISINYFSFVQCFFFSIFANAFDLFIVFFAVFAFRLSFYLDLEL